MKWIIAFIMISLLVLFHEFGHFVFAKLNGVDVEEFSLGFGPRLLSAVHGGTRYSLKILLFGGSCKMKGMYAEMELPDEDGIGGSAGGNPEEGSFNSVSVGRRASIIFGGPLFNFLLAFICAIIVLSVVGYDPAEVLYVAEGSSAETAGLRTGDLIVSYNGDHVDIGRDVATWEILHDYSADRDIRMTILRNGEKMELAYRPDANRRFMLGITYNPESETAEIGSVQKGSPIDEAGVRAGDIITQIDGVPIGTSEELSGYFTGHPLDGSEITLTLQRGGKSYETKVAPIEKEQLNTGFVYNLGRVRTDALGVLKYSVIEIRYWITTTVRCLGAMFTGRFGVNDLSGPVGIADMVGETYEESKKEGALMTWMNMINLIILLSANLGVMNLLPIPAIDGGRLVFLLIEAIRGKPMDEKLELSVQTVAAILLMMLMVYILYHDIARMIGP